MRFKFRAAFFKALNHMNDFFHSLARSVPSQIHWRLIPRLQSAKAASAFPRQHAPRQTDGNELARIMAGVQEGVTIAEVSDHGYGGIYSQAPALSLIQNLHDYGFKTPGLSVPPVLDSSDILRRERRLYEKFTSPFRGFDPTVKRQNMPGREKPRPGASREGGTD